MWTRALSGLFLGIWFVDACVAQGKPTEPATSNPCLSCGPYSICRSVNGSSVCLCELGYVGTPPACRPCVDNSECPQDKFCTKSGCKAINHKPVSSCLSGFTGDPFTKCTPDEETELDLCQPSPCGINADCKIINRIPNCNCLPGFAGNPLRICSPVESNATEASKSIYPNQQQVTTPAQPSASTPDKPCKASPSQASVSSYICSGQLLFEDNFLAPLSKGKLWEPEVRFPGAPDYPFIVYMSDENQISVHDGHLSIKPVLLEQKFGEGFILKSLDLTSGCTGEIDTDQCEKGAFGPQILPPIITGKITTKNKFNFRYGRVEIRAKLPRGDWLIPEIQLEPRDNKYGSSKYASGLIKVASVKGNDVLSRTLTAGVVMYDREPFRKYALFEKQGQDAWTRDYHNYTVVWKPDGISLFVDGVNYGNVDPGEGFSKVGFENQVPAARQWARGSLMAPFDEMFYVSLGLSAGGVNDFSDDILHKPWRNRSRKSLLQFWQARSSWYPTWHNEETELQVEYVRVYAL